MNDDIRTIPFPTPECPKCGHTLEKSGADRQYFKCVFKPCERNRIEPEDVEYA